VDAELDEGARVAEQVDALARGELAALVLERDLLLTPAELGPFPSSVSAFIPVSSPPST
jgi:hypothetical protein